MWPQAIPKSPPRRLARPVFIFLAGSLVAFTIWCLLLLARVQPLRRDLDLHLSWVDDLLRVHTSLESWHHGDLEQLPAPAMQKVRRQSLEHAGRHQGADWQIMTRRLDQAFAQLQQQAAGTTAPREQLWPASVAALAAASALEQRIQQHIGSLHNRLGGHWNMLNFLVVAALLLAASNLALLHLVQRRRRDLQAAHDKALALASHDHLTGLWNREAILDRLRHELARAARLEVPMGLIYADLDDFRQVNELLGQEQGDQVLRQLAQRMHSLVRPYDTLGRFGGDSFLVVLPSCDETATTGVARRLTEAVDGQEVEHALGKIRVTVSVAHQTIDQPRQADPDQLLQQLSQAAERRARDRRQALTGS